MRVKFIDVLKAVAIVAVVFYHMEYLKYGYLGVDLFLVVNGYFVTMILERKWDSIESIGKKPNFFKEGYLFILDRVLRLLPVLLVAMVFCLLWGFFVMLPDEYENLCESVVATDLFSNNILQSIVAKDYWDVDNLYKPLMHTWYVGVLMEFYIVYYIIYYFAKKYSYKYDWLSISILILGGGKFTVVYRL